MAEGIKKISENVIIDKRALVVTDYSVADNDAINIGALWTDPATKGLKLKVGQNSFSKLDASSTLLSGSITTDLLKDKAVTTLKLQDKSVTEPKLSDLAVSTRTIVNNAVTEQKLANASVTSSKLANNSVHNIHIGDKQITSNKIADNTIINSNIADKAIINRHLNDNSVDTRVLASNSVDTRHYNNYSITNSKYAKQSIFGEAIKNNSITSMHMAQNAIVTNAIANGAVNHDKLADNSVRNNNIQQGAVESIHLSTNSVTNQAINDSSISTSKYQDKSITKNKLADDVVTLIGDPVVYDSNNNVTLRKDMTVKGNVVVNGTLEAKKVFNAVFMDIAEGYEPEKDEVFNPGDIVQVNEEGKLIRAISSSHFPVVGVVSDEYATCYGATEEEIESGKKIPVGLIGKIHVNVVGSVKLGDKIALIKDGMGASCNTNNLLKDNVIGKALESNDKNEVKKVLCLVFPN